jgi:hypothetical protein
MALTQRDLSIDQLLLDPENPRLPEELQGAGQEAILRYMSDTAVLDELIRSMADNGYFQHEPLIVGPERLGGRHVVLEGNRRVAALKILHRTPEAEAEGLEPDLEEPLSASAREELEVIPCYEVDDRDEVHKYLGFRHIGGLKTWSPEAKARYLLTETRKAAESGEERPFLTVARQVGSNTQGVRNSYTAIALLQRARDEFELPISYVLRERFGVWLRCINAQDLRKYIGLDSPRSYEAVNAQIEEVKPNETAEVIGDLTPPNGGRPLLGDSRDVTIYAAVLVNKRAHETLRRYNDLNIARQVVELAELPTRLRNLAAQIQVALEEAQRAEVSEDLADAAEALTAVARSLRAIVLDRLEGGRG